MRTIPTSAFLNMEPPSWGETALDGGRAASMAPAAENCIDDAIDLGGMARTAVQLEVPADVAAQARLGGVLGVAEAQEERRALLELATVHLVAQGRLGSD